MPISPPFKPPRSLAANARVAPVGRRTTTGQRANPRTATGQLNESAETLRQLNERLYNFVRRRTPQSADAADVVADIWEITCREFEGRCALRTFLFVVARRRVADFWRCRNPRQELETGSLEDPEPLLEALESNIDLDAELDAELVRQTIPRGLLAVKERFRGAIELRLAGCSYQELMAEFGISYQTARTRTARGKAQLVAALSRQRRRHRWNGS